MRRFSRPSLEAVSSPRRRLLRWECPRRSAERQTGRAAMRLRLGCRCCLHGPRRCWLSSELPSSLLDRARLPLLPRLRPMRLGGRATTPGTGTSGARRGQAAARGPRRRQGVAEGELVAVVLGRLRRQGQEEEAAARLARLCCRTWRRVHPPRLLTRTGPLWCTLRPARRLLPARPSCFIGCSSGAGG